MVIAAKNFKLAPKKVFFIEKKNKRLKKPNSKKWKILSCPGNNSGATIEGKEEK